MAHGGTASESFSRPAQASLASAAVSNPAALALCGAVVLNDIEYDAYLANDRTLDDPLVVRTERSGRVRLRLINGASGTSFWIDLGAVGGEVIAADGNPVKPVKGSRFPLAQGQRLDILLDVPAGATLPVLAQREGERELTGIVLAAPGAAVAKLDKLARHKAPPIDLSLEEKLEAVTPLPLRKPNTKREISLAGTMAPFVWTINGHVWERRKDIRMQHGQRVIMELRNDSLMAHAMHLHGHCFQVIGLEDKPISGAVRDTVFEVLADGLLYQVMTETGFVDRPIFCLQEFIYGGPHSGPTAWSAERSMARHPNFDAGADPLLFTGEMMYPWMFSDIAALRPFARAAEILAATDDWPALYDPDRLAANEVPVAAAIYHDDMYVPSALQLRTVQATGNCRAWVTNEHEHDGIRVAGDEVLSRLMDMVAGRR